MVAPSQIDMHLSSLSFLPSTVLNPLLSEKDINFLLSYCSLSSLLSYISRYGTPTPFSPSLPSQMVAYRPPASTSLRVMFSVLFCFSFIRSSQAFPQQTPWKEKPGERVKEFIWLSQAVGYWKNHLKLFTKRILKKKTP